MCETVDTFVRACVYVYHHAYTGVNICVTCSICKHVCVCLFARIHVSECLCTFDYVCLFVCCVIIIVISSTTTIVIII